MSRCKSKRGGRASFERISRAKRHAGIIADPLASRFDRRMVGSQRSFALQRHLGIGFAGDPGFVMPDRLRQLLALAAVVGTTEKYQSEDHAGLLRSMNVAGDETVPV